MKNVHLNTTKLFIPLIAIPMIFGLNPSCKRAAEKTQEKLIEQSIGDNADVDIDDEKVVIKTDEGTFTTDASQHNWPSEIPDDIPEFTKGNIVMINTQEMPDGNNWVVMFENVPEGSFKAYKKQLENVNFNINFTTEAGSGYHFAAEKDNFIVMLMGDEKGASITITIQK